MALVPLPIVVGCNRSGTTLLRAMLDSHPDLAVVHESRFIPDLGARHAEGPFDPATFATDLTAHPSFGRLGLDPDAVRAACATDPPQTLPDGFRRVLAWYAENAGKPRAGDKTPEYVLEMPRLARLLPETRFVHVVRDGRDVATAIVDAPIGTADLAEAAAAWRRLVSAGRRDGKRLGPGRYLEVRYEALVDDPEAVLRTVCQFVGLSFDPSMLRYHERADDVIRHAGIPELHTAIRRPPTPLLRDWRQDLSQADVRRVESIAGDELQRFGYPLATPAGAAERLRWSIDRLRRR
jgi:hypothetical protein